MEVRRPQLVVGGLKRRTTDPLQLTNQPIAKRVSANYRSTMRVAFKEWAIVSTNDAKPVISVEEFEGKLNEIHRALELTVR